MYALNLEIDLYFQAIGPSYVTCSCPNGYTGNGVGPNGCTLNPTDCSSGCRNGQCSVSLKDNNVQQKSKRLPK